MNAADTTNQQPRSGCPALWRHLWPLGLLVLAAGGAFWLGSRSASESDANNGLVIEEQDLDFGAAWEASRFSWKLPIRNAGSSQVEVLDFATSCGCASLTPRSFALAPGETRDLELELNLALVASSHANDPWPFNTLIVPEIKHRAAQQAGWIVKGRVRKLLAVSPAGVFEPDLTRGQSFPSRTLKVTAAVPLAELRARCTREQGLVQVQGGPREFQVTIAPSPDLSPGPFQFEVELQPNREGPKLPAKSIVVQGFIHQDVEPLPNVVLFGAVPVGETMSDTINLMSRTGKPFSVKSWIASKKDLSVEPIAGNAHAYRVGQRATELGERRCRVTFSVVVDGTERIEVPVEMSYYGVEAKGF